MDTKEIMAGLYGIRAGLSVISEDADKLNESNRTIKEQEQILKKYHKDTSAKRNNLADSRYELHNYKDNITPYLDDKIAKRESAASSEIKKTVFKFIPTLLISLIPAFGISIALDFAISTFTALFINAYTNLILWENNTGLTIALIIIGAIIASIRITSIRISSTKNKKEAQIKKLVSDSEKNRSKLQYLESVVRANQAGVDLAVSAENKCKAETDSVIQAELDKQKEITMHANLTYTGLQKTYGSLLMEQDWSNIDLLIFYFITGRADTMKEALLLVDKERQTQRIVDAVNYASSQIRTAINHASTELGNLLAYNFKVLNNNIEAVAQNVKGLQSGVNSLTRGVMTLNATNSQILKTNELNSALIAKSMKNSDELVGELKYLKYKFQENHII